MKKTLTLTLSLLLAAVCQAKVVTDSIESRILGESVKYNVYLPKGFDQGSDRKYPVLYLLHGFTDTYCHIPYSSQQRPKSFLQRTGQ